MKTIQMTFDENLLKVVDSVVKSLNTTRSAFTRNALREAVKKFTTSSLEDKHRKGYQARPVNTSEFNDWEDEQDWGDM
nr:CopG family transcriptional regulator [Desulfobulbaceae bacterium]